MSRGIRGPLTVSQLYEDQLAELSRAFLSIHAGTCQPYLHAVFAEYSFYNTKQGHAYTVRYRACVYKVVTEGKSPGVRTLRLCPKKFHSGWAARSHMESVGVSGVLLDEWYPRSLHNMKLQVLTEGLNHLPIPGPSL
jgi:hypothetical protein